MNNSLAIASFSNNVLAKLPSDFINKHPGWVIGSGVFLASLPHLCRGAKYLIEKADKLCRYQIDAKYGKPATVIVEANREPVA